MICYKMDNDLFSLSINNACTYSRYADDITFSFTKKIGNIPKDIVFFDENNQVKIGDKLTKLIADHGFSVNYNKVRLKDRKQRQEVTGLTVNDRVNIKRNFIKKTMSMIYAWEKFGVQNAQLDYISKYNKIALGFAANNLIKNGNSEYFIEVVRGRVGFIGMVKGKEDIIYRKLAHRLAVLMGFPNNNFLKTPYDIIADSTFIVETASSNQGTAFLLEGVGLITNQHVVDDIDEYNSGNANFFRFYEENIIRKAEFIKSNKNYDLAIFHPLHDFNNIAFLKIGDDSSLKNGSKVSIIGFPQYQGGQSPYINTGKIIQSKIMFGQKYWLVDIPIISGNSGGPVVNEKNEVVGVATRGSKTHDQSSFNGFIPISILLKYFNSGQS